MPAFLRCIHRWRQIVYGSGREKRALVNCRHAALIVRSGAHFARSGAYSRQISTGRVGSRGTISARANERASVLPWRPFPMGRPRQPSAGLCGAFGWSGWLTNDTAVARGGEVLLHASSRRHWGGLFAFTPWFLRSFTGRKPYEYETVHPLGPANVFVDAHLLRSRARLANASRRRCGWRRTPYEYPQPWQNSH